MSAPFSAPPPPQPRMQFGLAGLMLVMFVVAVSLAPAFYFARASQGKAGMQLVGILLVLITPMLLVVILSVYLAIRRWLNR